MKSLPLQALWIVVTDSQADLDKGYGHFMWFFSSSLGCLSLSGCPGCSAIMVVSNAPFQPDPLQELLVVTVYCEELCAFIERNVLLLLLALR